MLTGTARWLATRSIDAHHHVLVGETSHYRRLARLVSGRAVGVVFGGGGARGSAHLGVVLALEEAGIPIDVVGGTSIGSVAAFMCAMGWDHQKRMEKLPFFFSRPLVLYPDHPVGVAVVRSPADEADVDETERRSIEDLWIRFFSASTNLSQATQMVHQRGELATALRASVSLPGIPAWKRSAGGRWSVEQPPDRRDAGSAGRRTDHCRGPPAPGGVRAAVGPALSGWQVLLRRARRGPEPFDPPGIASILARSVELAGLPNDRAVLDRPGLDLYLTPPGGGIGLLDFDAAPLLVQQAYR